MSNGQQRPDRGKWTEDQWTAITERNQHILVAAAAGSGKTAVLVERIIQRISDEQHPVDVDRLLVATFTNDAAAEMRQRIREALEQKLLQHPDSDHLKRQLALIHRASISTLHSFCLEVVQRYSSLLQIDPGFRVGNEIEMELMKQEVLEEVMEHFYTESEHDSDFWRLVDAYSGEKSDAPLFQFVLKLYDYSRSHPWPEHWLRQMAARFEQADELVQNKDHPWIQGLLRLIILDLNGVKERILEAIHLAQAPNGPIVYLENLQDDLKLVEDLIEAAEQRDWSLLFEAFQTLQFSKLKPARGEWINKDLQEQVKQLRDQVKKRLLELKEECFTRSLETYAEELNLIAPFMRELIHLVNTFGARYQQVKAEKRLVDFNDLEHYSLQILRHPDSTPDQLMPSDVALEYQKQFVEILLDEYQDTNRVQETIISLIARNNPGNIFMVGDVKQSIYRFRLAEPELFLRKYKSFRDGKTDSRTDIQTISDDGSHGLRIDLSKNFRSRREIVDGVNFIFKQLMYEAVAETTYDQHAQLVFGAPYPESNLQFGHQDYDIEFILLDRSSSNEDQDSSQGMEPSEDDNETSMDPAVLSLQEVETARLEARQIARQIQMLLGHDGTGTPFHVYDPKMGISRPITYRDIVILLRATHHWAPIMMEELSSAGIPSYAELNTGYFAAGEVEVVLSLLRIIDNPIQDIPLAGVLRSPMFQFTAEELALIRIHNKESSFYEAARSYANAEADVNEPLQRKLRYFFTQLEEWRTAARQGSLAQLIWDIYRKTGYYEIVGGMAGGAQRQANLRALYDRARQYETTSFRGLFRFLRFIDRMKESGGDLGTARALGEQEDVVRMMSIHKSKGLEFPVVFIAGLGKMFNVQDLNSSLLLHKDLGFGPRFVDLHTRVSYPTLPSIAIRRQLRMEMLAEEMRVLYVAFTRAKEKLFLVGTVRDAEQQIKTWLSIRSGNHTHLPDYVLVNATSFLDWIGPAWIRHPQAKPIRVQYMGDQHAGTYVEDVSKWKMSIVPLSSFREVAATDTRLDETKLQAIANTEPIRMDETWYTDEISRRLQWEYPFRQATSLFAKTSVSEMKRLIESEDDLTMFSGPSVTERSAPQRWLLRRPRFLEEKKLTAVERGTLYHAVMQYIPLVEDMIHIDRIESIMDEMVDKQLLTMEQKKGIDPAIIASFFTHELGQRLLQADRVYREVPFSYGLPAREVYPHADEETGNEMVLIQGVIDCLFEVENGLVLLDYKTDAVYHGNLERIKARYQLQIDLYARAVEAIWQRPVQEKYLFLFDGAHILPM